MLTRCPDDHYLAVAALLDNTAAPSAVLAPSTERSGQFIVLNGRSHEAWSTAAQNRRPQRGVHRPAQISSWRLRCGSRDLQFLHDSLPSTI